MTPEQILQGSKRGVLRVPSANSVGQPCDFGRNCDPSSYHDSGLMPLIQYTPSYGD